MSHVEQVEVLERECRDMPEADQLLAALRETATLLDEYAEIPSWRFLKWRRKLFQAQAANRRTQAELAKLKASGRS